jgi:uncharacterized iron-regulated membrane protein
MKLFRKILFWCHLTTGVIAGIVILIMSVTGVLLTYEKQMIAWADTRNYQVAPPTATTPRLPVETLLAKVREAQPGATLTSVTLRADATEPAAIALAANPGAGPGGARTLFVNPYTGAVLGESAQGIRNFFRVVTDWHRWLGAKGENRATARAITGTCNLGFLFIVVSGFYLWWPRTWTWTQFKNVLWFKRGLPSKARDFNWHNVIGFWSVAPLFFIVLSGVVISYSWAGNLVYRVVGETPPVPAARSAAPQGAGGANAERRGENAQAKEIPLDGLNQLWTRAEQQMPGWQTISLRLPNNADAPVAFTIDQGYAGQPHKRGQLTLNRQSGQIVKWEPFASFTKGRQLRSVLRFAHTGEIGGLAGQTVAGLVTLGSVFLVWTGLALSWGRLRAWRARQPKVAAEVLAKGAEA